MISTNELKIKINEAASQKEDFLFYIDYEKTKGEFILHPKDTEKVLWRVGSHTNADITKQILASDEKKKIIPYPMSYAQYRKKFDRVHTQLQEGNSFLANLTIQTPIETNYSFEDIFYKSKSSYALMVPNQFVCFSPEIFIQISKGIISSYPMKGTISADIKNAQTVILNSYKETAEHHTIVDLIRSDLSRVSGHIRVDKFRYIEKVSTSQGEILQVSSQISGDIFEQYHNLLGDLIMELLPAGSICGAPKESTIDILQKAEGEPRGFYTGVFGYFDGENLNTAVMIRYIEKENQHLYFRSGGGITINSICQEEYEEALQKVYLPFIS